MNINAQISDWLELKCLFPVVSLLGVVTLLWTLVPCSQLDTKRVPFRVGIRNSQTRWSSMDSSASHHWSDQGTPWLPGSLPSSLHGYAGKRGQHPQTVGRTLCINCERKGGFWGSHIHERGSQLGAVIHICDSRTQMAMARNHRFDGNLGSILNSRSAQINAAS